MKKSNYKWVVLVFLSAAIFYFVYSFLIVELSIEPMKGTLSRDKIIFEAYKDNISFGETKDGYQIIRLSNIENNFDFPIKTYFFPTGEIKELVSVIPGSLYLEPQRSKYVNLFFTRTPEKDYGEYQGKLIILSRRTILGV